MSADFDTIVVGGGLFGQITAAALRRIGQKVAVLDCNKRQAGSAPAACLMKPSWFSMLGKDVYDPALKLLDNLYRVEDIDFELRAKKTGLKVGSATVHWINPKSILGRHLTLSTVTKIAEGRVETNKGEMTADTIVVAAGIWTEELLPQYKQVAQKGVAFLWPAVVISTPFIHPYAPYKQLVAFNRGDGLWVGDGTAIIEDNWTDDYFMRSFQRCTSSVSTQREPMPIFGLRPYARGHKPCWLEQPMKNVWVATGGAKNGTIAAGYCAHIISQRAQ